MWKMYVYVLDHVFMYIMPDINNTSLTHSSLALKLCVFWSLYKKKGPAVCLVEAAVTLENVLFSLASFGQ